MIRRVDPVLSRDGVRTLLEKAFDGLDPLGYERSGGDMEEVDCDVEQINRMDELAAAALRGELPEEAKALADLAAAPLDAATLALLRAMGIDPDAALGIKDLIGTLRDPMEIIDASGDEDVVVTGDDAIWRLKLGDGVAWTARIGTGMKPAVSIHIPPLPHTVAAGLVGSPLSAAASHPALDACDLRISRVEASDRDCVLHMD